MKKVAVLPFDDPESRRIAATVAPTLLAWYDAHRRTLPWRSAPGVGSDPYVVWLSEIMLQQTTVAAVRPYFAAFLAAWPTVDALARASLDEVLRAWAGLGYYSRARNLHACARMVVDAFGGSFPCDEAVLRSLPGVGRYTAAAIAAIAFGRRAVVVDGNVERVMARLFAVETPLPQAKPLLHVAMDRVTPETRAGDFAQATMDLGATICTPRSPACGLCPLRPTCRAFAIGIVHMLPLKAAKKAVPLRGGAVMVIRRDDGAMLVQQRAAQGLFGGMTEFPSTSWTETFDRHQAPNWPKDLLDLAIDPMAIGTVSHGLTHFTLELHVYVAKSDRQRDVGDMRWVAADSINAEALPTLMRKVLALALTVAMPAEGESVTRSLNDAATLPFPNVVPTRPRPSAPGPDWSRTRRRLRQERRRRSL